MLVVLLSSLLLAASFGPLRSLEPRLPMATTSVNWSGYDVAVRPGRRLRSVYSSWTEPSLNCPEVDPGGASVPVAGEVAVWVGLDGDGSRTVEQIGTDASCSGDVQLHEAWIEMYPDWPETLPIEINAGDHIQASVSYAGTGRYVLVMADTSTGAKYKGVRRCPEVCPRTSAEAIVEAPYSFWTGVLPLAPFGTVTFGPLLIDGHDASTHPLLDAISMTDPADRSKLRTQPGPLSPRGFNLVQLGR